MIRADRIVGWRSQPRIARIAAALALAPFGPPAQSDADQCQERTEDHRDDDDDVQRCFTGEEDPVSHSAVCGQYAGSTVAGDTRRCHGRKQRSMGPQAQLPGRVRSASFDLQLTKDPDRELPRSWVRSYPDGSKVEFDIAWEWSVPDEATLVRIADVAAVIPVAQEARVADLDSGQPAPLATGSNSRLFYPQGAPGPCVYAYNYRNTSTATSGQAASTVETATTCGSRHGAARR